MNKKLKLMTERPTFAAYRLTSTGRLELLGRERKIVENYFLFDGTDFYFGNSLVTLSSSTYEENKLILAATDTKLLVPQENGNALYIARNYPVKVNFCAVVLYQYSDYLYFLLVSGSGSGRVHPIYLPLTTESFNFYFNCAVNAIAAVNPKLGETLYENIKKKVKEAKDRLQSNED
jgi:hypothetical protein